MYSSGLTAGNVWFFKAVAMRNTDALGIETTDGLSGFGLYNFKVWTKWSELGTQSFTFKTILDSRWHIQILHTITAMN